MNPELRLTAQYRSNNDPSRSPSKHLKSAMTNSKKAPIITSQKYPKDFIEMTEEQQMLINYKTKEVCYDIIENYLAAIKPEGKYEAKISKNDLKHPSNDTFQIIFTILWNELDGGDKKFDLFGGKIFKILNGMDCPISISKDQIQEISRPELWTLGLNILVWLVDLIKDAQDWSFDELEPIGDISRLTVEEQVLQLLVHNPEMDEHELISQVVQNVDNHAEEIQKEIDMRVFELERIRHENAQLLNERLNLDNKMAKEEALKGEIAKINEENQKISKLVEEKLTKGEKIQANLNETVAEIGFLSNKIDELKLQIKNQNMSKDDYSKIKSDILNLNESINQTQQKIENLNLVKLEKENKISKINEEANGFLESINSSSYIVENPSQTISSDILDFENENENEKGMNALYKFDEMLYSDMLQLKERISVLESKKVPLGVDLSNLELEIKRLQKTISDLKANFQKMHEENEMSIAKETQMYEEITQLKNQSMEKNLALQKSINEEKTKFEKFMEEKVEAEKELERIRLELIDVANFFSSIKREILAEIFDFKRKVQNMLKLRLSHDAEFLKQIDETNYE